ncbi:uncharacterized protein [Rutidosis leptorrhynchoides]|uniref:uncharacterized protein n=1 Tax=Rutidosis leptorrhynchoides TaxID=125765 RepID=UPI003A98DA2E
MGNKDYLGRHLSPVPQRLCQTKSCWCSFLTGFKRRIFMGFFLNLLILTSSPITMKLLSILWILVLLGANLMRDPIQIWKNWRFVLVNYALVVIRYYMVFKLNCGNKVSRNRLFVVLEEKVFNILQTQWRPRYNLS